jgi:hypothetical protein
MFSRFYKKVVLCLIVVSLIIPSGLFFYPKPANAESVSCLAYIGGFFGVNKVLSALTAVPISNNTVEMSAAGGFAKVCIIEPLVTQLAKAMLYNITVSTVEWINSGFQGNPGFVQDFRGLLNETADSVIGEFLQKEAAFLCTPFAFQVRVQLAQSYLPYRQRAACTLSDVNRNINNFAKNNNGLGWDNWLEVTTVPQNNQYGAFVIAQDEISKRIVDAQALKKTYLDWGRGFKDFEVCETQAEAVERQRQAGGNLGAELAVPECTKQTPGAIVQNRLEKTLGMDLEQLGVANNLNAIMDALANQFTKQIVNGTVGLLGGKKAPNEKQHPGWGSVTYDEAIKANNNDNSLSEAIDTSLEETNAELAPFFTESAAIDPGDTPASLDEETVTPEERTIGLSVVTSGSPTVTNFDPLSYEVDLESNYSDNSYGVRMVFKKNGSPVPISSIFNAPQQITFGRSDLYYSTQNVNHPTNADIYWSPISTSKSAKYVFKFTGSKNINAKPGTYTIETILTDPAGKLMESKTSAFVVQ